MDWVDAFNMADDTAEEVVAKVEAMIETTNTFYKWGVVENEKLPAIGELARCVLSLAKEIAELKNSRGGG